jgi:hypothetical protein
MSDTYISSRYRAVHRRLLQARSQVCVHTPGAIEVFSILLLGLCPSYVLLLFLCARSPYVQFENTEESVGGGVTLHATPALDQATGQLDPSTQGMHSTPVSSVSSVSSLLVMQFALVLTSVGEVSSSGSTAHISLSPCLLLERSALAHSPDLTHARGLTHTHTHTYTPISQYGSSFHFFSLASFPSGHDHTEGTSL